MVLCGEEGPTLWAPVIISRILHTACVLNVFLDWWVFKGCFVFFLKSTHFRDLRAQVLGPSFWYLYFSF